ncbi:MAG: hypothetical protein JWL72_2980 [Ilumatobacteraceae bacterium]|nr:hypothetical protein [Ilumatobacteraceae bacterium]MCU1389642.1 hypothetical protein [Ilumatobacteraceae bacterium]
MQFVLLIFQGTTPTPTSPKWSNLSPDEQQAIYADYAALNSAPGVTPGLPLGLPEAARTVTVTAGTARVADGPYLQDAAKAAGGYLVVEADDIDGAIAIAARVPAARHGGGIEIRPVATYW